MAKLLCIAVAVFFCILSVTANPYLVDRLLRRRQSLSSASASASASSLGDGFGSSRSAAAADASAVSDGLGGSSSRANANAVAQSLSRRPFFNRLGGSRFGRCEYDECRGDYECYSPGQICDRDSYGCYRCINYGRGRGIFRRGRGSFRRGLGSFRRGRGDLW